ncbi:MAG: segregation ATPase FtsK/SpoIIIE, family, partial [Gaiellaceae bacterium]|nr:segregation ATPase FtsK/SpoIIIE, family [Gaiellaceae bacterium]
MATTRAPSLVELRLVATAGDERRDVRVEAAPDLTSGELVAAIGADLGAAGPATLHGEPLPEDVPVSELALRWGDELRFGARDRRPDPELLTLVVSGGPHAGLTVPLRPGTHVVGREGSIELDDPSLSGRHVVIVVSADGSATIADAGSRNGSVLDGTPLVPGEPVPLEPGRLVRAGRSLFGLERPGVPAHPDGGAGGLVQFNRPPRVRRAPPPRVRPFPAPPADPQRSRLPLGASLIPLVLGVGLYFLTRVPTMLFFSLLSPVMAVTTYAEDRRSGRKGFQTNSGSYRRSLQDLGGELEDERRAELSERRTAAPSAPELLERARRHDPLLWERRPGDDDFLELRIGTADLPSLLSVTLDAGGNGELRRDAQSIVDWYAVAPAVPVTIAAADAGTVGIAGPRERVDGLARWLLAQAAALHSPAELVIAAALGPGAGDAWDWLKWLPHADDAGGLLSRRLGVGPVGARSVIEDVARLVSARRNEGSASLGGAQGRTPHLLFLIDETVAPERSLASDVLAAGDAGVTVVWLARQRRDLPGQSGLVLQLDDGS